MYAELFTLSKETSNDQLTRMYSSRMCTARSSSRVLGEGVSASVHAGIHTPPPRCGPGDPPGPTP